MLQLLMVMLFFASRRRHTRYWRNWSSDVCSSDLARVLRQEIAPADEEVAAALGVAAGSDVILLERLRLGGGDPMAIECAYLRADRSEERRVGEEGSSWWSPYH